MTGGAASADPWRGVMPLLLWAITLAAVTLTPLLIAPPARNAFRLPKVLFFQGAMLLVGGAAAAWLLVRLPSLRRLGSHRIAVVIAGATVLWTVIVSLAARQPELARFAPVAVGTYAILFVLVLLFERGVLLPLLALLVPAGANAAISLLQVAHLWSPVPIDPQGGRMHVIGLLGNPDYVGIYLIVPCVTALAAAFAFPRLRLLFLFFFVLTLAGIVVAQSVTAIVGIVAGLIVFAFVAPGRTMRIAVASLTVVVLIALSAYGPTRRRAVTLVEHLREGRHSEFWSYRLPAFAVASDMFLERPLLGVGPGGYEAKYMSYKIANDERFPEWISLGNRNFGEAHNDHLQLLAEAGLPGYALFILALVATGALTFRRKHDARDQRQEFARMFALPAACAFALIALAQFPLHLAESMATSIFAAALAHAWSIPARDDPESRA